MRLGDGGVRRGVSNGRVRKQERKGRMKRGNVGGKRRVARKGEGVWAEKEGKKKKKKEGKGRERRGVA